MIANCPTETANWYGLCFSKIMDQFSDYRITCEFKYNRRFYIAYISPYYELSEYEIRAYNIHEYMYVVHLFSLDGFKTFEIFPDKTNTWVTNASNLLVNNQIVGIISYVLTNVFK